MRLPWLPVAALLLAALGVPAGARAARRCAGTARAPGEVGGDAACAEVARILARAAETPDPRAPERIAAVPGAAGVWLRGRADGRIEGLGALTPEQRETLRLAGPELPPSEAVAAARTAGAATPEARLAALELLRWHGSAAEIDLALDLAGAPAGSVAAEPSDGAGGALAEAFEQALAAVLARDVRGYAKLPHAALRAGPLRASILRGVGLAGDPRALDWLAGEVLDPEVGGAALLAIERLAPRASAEEAQAAAERLRPLLGADDASRRAHAVRVLGSLRDDAAVPGMIALLSAGGRGEQRAAHAALRAVTGRGLPATPEAWIAWYQSELSWFREQAPAAIERLGSEDDAEVVAAARALSERGLFRLRTALELARLATDHPSAAVRAEACRGLARLDARPGLDALRAAADDEDETVRAAAEAGLRALEPLARAAR